MTSHRRIFLTGAIAAVLPVGMPTLAAANSLLSGYGGPGQGSQAILGSTLLGGGSGGDGGGGRSGVSSGSFRYGERPGGTDSSATSSAGAGGSSGRKSAGGGTPGSQAGSGGASGGDASTYPPSSAERASGAGAGESETLGLYGDDRLYVLLVLAGLAFTGVLTRQLARTKAAGRYQPLKRRVAGPE